MYKPHIKTKFLAPTCFQGPRLKAMCQGHPSKVYPWSQNLSSENCHFGLAQVYLREVIGDSYRITSYTDSEDGRGYLFLFSRREA